MDLLKKQIQENPAIHKKLVRLKKTNNYQNLTEKSLNKMIENAQKINLPSHITILLPAVFPHQ